MAAPHQVSDKARSLTRVLNNGRVKPDKSTSGNLAKVISVARAIDIPRNNPPIKNTSDSPLCIVSIKLPKTEQKKRPISEVISLPPITQKATLFAKSTTGHLTPVNVLAVPIPDEVQKIKLENELLRKENGILKNKLSLFIQLFCNPTRLNAVLRRLKERAQAAQAA